MIVDALHLLARANLAGGLAIAAVALLRRPVRAGFGASAAYGLWALPLLVALASLAPALPGAPLAPVVLAAARSLAAAAPPLDAGSSGAAWIALSWALGALVCAGMIAGDQLRFAAALRGARPTVHGRRVVRAASDIGPAVVGRAIVLPADFEARFTCAEQAAVLAHEAQHLARGDVAANGLVALVQCLCWFNPLVHLAAHWIRFDQELACDAAVIAARPALRRPYAEALLKTQRVAVIPPLGCAWRPRGAPALKARIRLLKQRAPSGPRRALAAVLLAGLTLGAGYTAWAAQPAPRGFVTQPDWVRKPTSADLVRFYPRAALAQRVEGMAVMQCRVGRSGELSACRIIRETPQGAGFGTATLGMAPTFQMKPMSRNGRPVAGGVVRIPVRFAIPAGPAAKS